MEMETTIRGQVRSIITHVHKNADNMFGNEMSQCMLNLTLLLPNVSQEQVENETEYLKLLNQYLEDDPKLSKAKAEVRAQVSEFYKRSRQAKHLHEDMIEIIRALKYRMKMLENEEKSTQN